MMTTKSRLKLHGDEDYEYLRHQTFQRKNIIDVIPTDSLDQNNIQSIQLLLIILSIIAGNVGYFRQCCNTVLIFLTVLDLTSYLISRVIILPDGYL